MGRRNAKPRRTVAGPPGGPPKRRSHRPSAYLVLLAGPATVAAVAGALLTADGPDPVIPRSGLGGAHQAPAAHGAHDAAAPDPVAVPAADPRAAAEMTASQPKGEGQ